MSFQYLNSASLYCENFLHPVRRISREVKVGSVVMGGKQPIRIQSMTTTNAEDVDATVLATKTLADHGCEIVRITAPNLAAAKALRPVRKKLNEEGYAHVPLVADIHFLPQAAMEAALHVEKVRINPGNFADKKKFAVTEYTNQAYALELERLYEAVTPLILRCKELGRTMRIGTNHGSLSDRILNRYGDTPMGMVESAMEFLRIARSHNYHDLVLSMKASNPKVMIQAYRLAAAKMAEEGMDYPFHLGVTEAGDGEDGRIKSTIGIGSLLLDGIGDTIRVSLTENPINEIPIAKEIAHRIETLWNAPKPNTTPLALTYNPYDYERREAYEISLAPNASLGKTQPVRVVLSLPLALQDVPGSIQALHNLRARFKDQPIEGISLKVNSLQEIHMLEEFTKILAPSIGSFWITLSDNQLQEALLNAKCTGNLILIVEAKIPSDIEHLKAITQHGLKIAIVADGDFIHAHHEKLFAFKDNLIFSAPPPLNSTHVGTIRYLAAALSARGLQSPIWLRFTSDHAIHSETNGFTPWLIESSLFLGSLLIDGIGEVITLDLPLSPDQLLTLSYNLLQGTRNRFTKTEFVACPSCGRTLFDLETTTQKVRSATGHLKGLTIAIMGCIVNGPGEMADADFGYVGGAPGKINLYVKKTCVAYNIPEAEAVERLIALIKEHGKWIEPA